MRNKLTLGPSLEILSAFIATAAFLGVLQTFIIGKHYVIPTMILFFAVIFANLARFAYRGMAWAKQVLFWIFFVLSCHAFFALFWAAKPREIFGAAFPYLYGGFLLVMIALLIPYAKRNEIFARSAGHTGDE